MWTLPNHLSTTLLLLMGVCPAAVSGFSPLSRPLTLSQTQLVTSLRTPPAPASASPLFCSSKNSNHDNDFGSQKCGIYDNERSGRISKRQHLKNLWRSIQQRSNTLEAANLPDARTAGLFGRVKKLHDPKTYLVLALLSGLKFDWCFKSPYFWFAVAFCIKWYRARYVFKIPVWDRQPNWNNVITSKDQEKDLKAFTCKNCGSTIFIAKTREFFFEGTTGIGGLGCFSCGAKGKDNFVMDRDRIVEDVADEDDYFDYESPLDFVSRAERRKLLKETKGDEQKANQILAERATGMTSKEESSEEETDKSIENEDSGIVDAEVETENVQAEEIEAVDNENSENEDSPEDVAEIKSQEVEEPPKEITKEPEEKKIDDDDDAELDLDNL